MGGGNSTRNSTSLSGIGSGAHRFEKMLTGIMSEEERDLIQYYRDMYNYDSVAGSAVDLISTMPFSDWTLVGLKDTELEKFETSTDRLNLKTMLPEISVEYLVAGCFTSTLIYKEATKTFTDMIPYEREACKFQQMPLYGVDPLIKVSPGQDIRQFLESNDQRVSDLRQRLNPKFIEALKSKEFALDPLVTLFIPRKTTPQSLGTSYYRRILPIYLLEKLLYRGTITEAGKRQRSLLHLVAGDEEWEPTAEELNALVGIFQQADLDPLGAIIATRQSVNPSEIRQGGDFWKYTDIIDQTTPLKLRALGISESFLSGDSTFATAETNLVVFMENLNTYRNMITQKIFTGKLFPIISAVNGFYKDGTRDEKLSKSKLTSLVSDPSSLKVPELRWHKSLHPRNDSSQMDVLDHLADKGVPIPLRMLAAAGGINLEALIKDLKEEKGLKKKLEQFAGESGNAEEEGGGEEASMGGVFRRYYDKPHYSEVVGSTKTGKRKYVPNQNKANRDVNLAITKAVASMADTNRYEEIKAKIISRVGRIPSVL